MQNKLEILDCIFHLREMLYSEIRAQFAQAGFTNAEILVLYHLQHKNKYAKVSELAADLFLPMSTLTGIIDKMVERNIVIRERNPEDRRIVAIQLHPEFRRQSEQSMKTLEGIMQDLFRNEETQWLTQLHENLKHLELILQKRKYVNE